MTASLDFYIYLYPCYLRAWFKSKLKTVVQRKGEENGDKIRVKKGKCKTKNGIKLCREHINEGCKTCE